MGKARHWKELVLLGMIVVLLLIRRWQRVLGRELEKWWMERMAQRRLGWRRQRAESKKEQEREGESKRERERESKRVRGQERKRESKREREREREKLWRWKD